MVTFYLRNKQHIFISQRFGSVCLHQELVKSEKYSAYIYSFLSYHRNRPTFHVVTCILLWQQCLKRFGFGIYRTQVSWENFDKVGTESGPKWDRKLEHFCFSSPFPDKFTLLRHINFISIHIYRYELSLWYINQRSIYGIFAYINFI